MILELSFDDASAQDMRVAELLDKYSLTATFYVPAMWQSYCTQKGWPALTKEQVIELSDRFEVGSHTITHPLLTRIPYGAAEYEIAKSKPMLENLIGKEITKFSYPRGYATDQIRDIVRQHYLHARSTLVGNIDPPEDNIWENTTVHVACERTEYGEEHWYDYAVRHLEKAVTRKNGYFHLWGHSHEIDKNNAWDRFESLLQLVKEYK